MITAKNIFSLEREMILELQSMVYTSDLSHEEKGHVFNRLESEVTESEYDQIFNTVMQRQPHPLTKIKNGTGVKSKEINIAVRKAADSE